MAKFLVFDVKELPALLEVKGTEGSILNPVKLGTGQVGISPEEFNHPQFQHFFKGLTNFSTKLTEVDYVKFDYKADPTQYTKENSPKIEIPTKDVTNTK